MSYKYLFIIVFQSATNINFESFHGFFFIHTDEMMYTTDRNHIKAEAMVHCLETAQKLCRDLELPNSVSFFLTAQQGFVHVVNCSIAVYLLSIVTARQKQPMHFCSAIFLFLSKT